MSGRIDGHRDISDPDTPGLRLGEYEDQFEDPFMQVITTEYADHLSLTEIYDDEVNIHD